MRKQAKSFTLILFHKTWQWLHFCLYLLYRYCYTLLYFNFFFDWTPFRTLILFICE